jgi:YjbE family integral membrane protein
MLHAEITALLSVIVIDLVLAGDNAVVVGMAAAGLRRDIRRKAIFYGIAAAAALRIVFALFTTQLLGVLGLVLAGGLLLLWVTWKLWREIRSGNHVVPDCDAGEAGCTGAEPAAAAPGGEKTLRQALTQIVVADVSMSLDNVLAVAGTARHHLWVLVVGLSLSVALMGLAATVIAGILKKYPWISYLGLALIAWVALGMIWEGGHQVASAAQRAGLLGGPHALFNGN